MSNYEQNSLGNRQNYGPRDTDKGLGNTIGTSSLEKTFEVPFDYDNLPANNEYDQSIPTIPAGSVIVEARLVVSEAFSGGSVAKLDIGLNEADGTAIDADGLFNDAAITVGSEKGAGALIDASIGSNPGQIVVAPLTAADAAATPTAGAGKIYVKVLLPQA